MNAEFEVSYDASPSTLTALERVQRTEDLRFSPTGRRMALVSFDLDVVVIVELSIVMEGLRPRISVNDVAELSSPRLRDPHGIDFLDEETIVVASRAGAVDLFRLPSAAAGDESAALTPIDLAPGGEFALLGGASEVAIARRTESEVELLVCNNDDDTLTRHLLHDDGSAPPAVTLNEVLLHRRLALPDGVAVSPDGAWIAISNHNGHRVMMYERAPSLNERSDPHGILRGAFCPHGLRFTADGGSLLVADAESPYVHVYVRRGEGWGGVQFHPAFSLRVMDDDVFERGRGPGQGGPKGVDLDPSGAVLAVTSQYRPLVFFDAPAILDASRGRRDDQERQLTEELRMFEQERFAGARFVTRIARLEGSTSYRVTKPLRHFKVAWSKVRDRGRSARGG